MQKTKYFSPLILAIIVLFVLAAITAVWAFNKSSRLSYALDDAYIHMAIAKNLADHGIWGVTTYRFSGSSSSLLYTCILAAFFRIFGTNEYIPAIINLAAAIAVLGIFFSFLRRQKFSGLEIFIVLVGVIFVLPMIALISSGMEHTTHIAFALLSLYLFTGLLTREKNNLSHVAFASLAAFFMVCARYEGLFMVAAACFLLFCRKRILSAFALGISAWAGPVIYGIFAKAHGGFFLPNTLLLKGPAISDRAGFQVLFGIAKRFCSTLKDPDALPVLSVCFLLLMLMVFSKVKKTLTMQKKYMTLLVMFSVFLHACFARFGWLFRYEAYLLAMSIMTMCIYREDIYSAFPVLESIQSGKAVSVKPIAIKKRLALILLKCVLLLLISPPLIHLAYRAKDSIFKVPQAMCNIYHQQHQTALFLREYYTGQKVIISDVGAPTFFADIDIIDVIGLGTDEILPELLKKRKYEYIAEQVDAKIAILLQRGAGKLVRDAGFIKVAKCTIKNNVVCANDKTYYIARNEASAKQLADNIREFSASMPKDVTVELFYDSSAGPE